MADEKYLKHFGNRLLSLWQLVIQALLWRQKLQMQTFASHRDVLEK